MRSVEINTTQNVAIEYELASWRDRMLAFAIDGAILYVSILMLFFFTEISFQGHIKRYLSFLIIIPIFLFYSLAWEVFNNGQSIGKKALGIKVAKLDGQSVRIRDYITRWAFRMVDIYFSLGSIASILISSTDKSQRLGDILSHCVVIKIRPSVRLKLENILKINSLENYQVTFPQVAQLKEEEVLLIKTVLDREKKYPNEAHKQVMSMLISRITQLLGIVEKPKNGKEFLKKIINDYIVLTR